MAKFVVFALSIVLSAYAGRVNYTYDDAHRLVKVEYEGGQTITYSYDKAGNLVSRVVTGTPPAAAPAVRRGTGRAPAKAAQPKRPASRR